MNTSLAKIEANRRNAQRSTGPRSAEGRAVSSRNAFRTGLTATTLVVMPGETQEGLDRLSESIRQEWNPSGDHENFLVHQMIAARWRLERLARWEAEAIDKIVEGPEDFFDKEQARRFQAKSADRLVIDAIQGNNIIFDKLERYTRAAERAYSKAVKELQQHRAASVKSAKQNEATANRTKPKTPGNASCRKAEASKNAASPNYWRVSGSASRTRTVPFPGWRREAMNGSTSNNDTIELDVHHF